jgi:flagellar hook-basal body complex protein FliE
MSIDAISGLARVSGIGGVSGVGGVGGVGALDTGAPATSTGGGDFAGQLGASLQHLQDLDTNTDNLAVQAATGQLTDVHDYIIAATQANLATQLTVQVRNKALDAFNEIMRMQA